MKPMTPPGIAAAALVASAATIAVLAGVSPGALSFAVDLLSSDAGIETDLEDVQLQVDPDYLVSVPRNVQESVWTEFGIVVSTSHPGGPDLLHRVVVKRPLHPLRRIDLPSASRDCWKLEYRRLVAAPGGLDAVQECGIRNTFTFVQRLVHIDLRTGSVAPLFDVGWADRALQGFTLSPNRNYAIASEGSLICNSLLRISDQGYSRPVMSPADLVPGQGRPETAGFEGRDGCSGEGVAWASALSASGDLAFEASPAATEEGGFGRLTAYSSVYLRSAGSLEAEPLVDDVSDARLAWHPTEPVLALSAIWNDIGGIVLVDPDSGAQTKVSSSGWAGPISWDPEGTRLLAVMRGASEDGKIRKWLVSYQVCGDLPGVSANPRSPLADYECNRAGASPTPAP